MHNHVIRNRTLYDKNIKYNVYLEYFSIYSFFSSSTFPFNTFVAHFLKTTLESVTSWLQATPSNSDLATYSDGQCESSFSAELSSSNSSYLYLVQMDPNLAYRIGPGRLE